jgi:hypothetical protein
LRIKKKAAGFHVHRDLSKRKELAVTGRGIGSGHGNLN